MGLQSPLQLTTARSKYITAQENLLHTKYEYILELVNLKYLVGDLNQRSITEINRWLL